MKEGSRTNALLVELLLVIFFFMISATIVVQVFADARLKSRTARAINASMLEAQNIAEDLYASDHPDAVLADYGFVHQGESWILEKSGYRMTVTCLEEETESGILRTYDVSGTEGENTLLTISSARYFPKEAEP